MRYWLTILTMLILAACQPEPALIVTTQQATQVATSEAHFREVDCVQRVPVEAVCGLLTVPQNRSDPAQGTIELPVIVFKSDNPQPDPVVHLVGGPGGDLLAGASFYLQRGGMQILADRDYILFNQRGTAFTTHALDCPRYNALRYELAATTLPDEEQNAQFAAALADCRADWQARGADLSAYTSAENAADVDALRQALGYEQLNLYGISYGSRLALTVMRDYPDSVRSAILDSVFPPQADLFSEVALNAHRAFEQVFATCATCESDLYGAFEALEEEPQAVRLPQGDTIMVDGNLYLETLFVMLYRADLVPAVPQVIEQVAAGDVQILARYVDLALDWEGISVGMYYSVQCSEDAAFDSYADAQAKAVDLPPVFAAHFVEQQPYDLCAQWPTADLPALEDQAVESDIPTLIVSGQYDPITPPAWGDLAAQTLPNSYTFVFEDVGHGVIRSDACALAIALDFLDDPTQAPAAACK